MNKVLSQLRPGAALRGFGIRQTIKGALILGALFGLLLFVQGAGYEATYPSEVDRQKFAATFGSTPAIGILYGEADGLLTAKGYMVYRGVAALGLIGSIWALLVGTRLLRGAEEDGRWESIVSSQTTKRRATLHLVSGAYISFVIGYIVSTLLTFMLGQTAALNVTMIESITLNAALFLPILIALGLGAFTSQLALTRRRATTYGIVAIIVAFTLRSIGNVLPDWYWLKNWTPFGWADQLRPITDLHPWWLLPLAITGIFLGGVSVYLAGKRDLGASLLRESQRASSRFYLLKTPWQLDLRLNFGVFVSWAIAVIALSAIVTSVAKVATEAVAESATLSQSILQLSGGQKDKLVLAFIGAGVIFTATVLMIMAAVCISLIRRDEAKQYLENILVQPIGRIRWLTSRLVLVIGAITITALLSNICVLAIAQSQDITIDASLIILGNLQLLGAVTFVIGVGVALYGIFPRLASPTIYVVIAWSFLVDLIGSVVTLPDIIQDSSLFHYISLVPAVDPDWSTFTWLMCIACVLIAIGIWSFTRRDYVTE